MSLSPIIEQASCSAPLLGVQLVTPGEVITTDPSYMRGHGTYLDENNHLRSSIAGLVSKLNRLVLVKPLSTRRYVGDIGDVVIGRVLDIGNKRWRVDIRARQDSILQLSSIPLPGGIQRRKSEEDELMMRSFFSEGQILVAEVQTLFGDGALGIHTRNARYGKLLTGELIAVQPSLIKRSKSHFGITEWGVELIIGINGYIWIGKPRKVSLKSSALLDLDEASLTLYNNDVEPVSLAEREGISRTRNLILMMDKYHCPIDESSVKQAFNLSSILSPFEILKEENAAYFIGSLSK
jgi:exosome complex component RRP4